MKIRFFLNTNVHNNHSPVSFYTMIMHTYIVTFKKYKRIA